MKKPARVEIFNQERGHVQGKRGRVVNPNEFYLLKKKLTFSSVKLPFYQRADNCNTDIMQQH
jgi:hypothetical protein